MWQKDGAEPKRQDFHAQERCCMQHGGKTRHVRKEHTASCVTSVWMSKLQSRGQRNATAFFREQSMAADVGLCRKEPACACFWLTTFLIVFHHNKAHPLHHRLVTHKVGHWLSLRNRQRRTCKLVPERAGTRAGTRAYRHTCRHREELARCSCESMFEPQF